MVNKPYPKYKASSVEWLGDVPEHWEVKRTRFILSLNPSKQEINHLDPDAEIVFLPMEAVGEDGSLRLDSTRPISDVNAGYTFFAEGDVAFAKITPCFENGKGAIMRNLGAGFGFGTTELTVMRPSKKLDAEYLYYITISHDFRHNGEAWMYGAGGQKRVPDEFVKEFRFAFPPLPEQQSIAAFLDRETGRIDALIAKKQRLLELLAEQRTALISRAVTKGLASTGLSTGDASVKLKPSGVEWLGDVPEHWGVKKLKHITITISKGTTPSTEGLEILEDGSIRFIKAENIICNQLSQVPAFFINEETNTVLKRSVLEREDVLIVIAGATIGKVAIIDTDFLPANTNQAVCFIRLKRKEQCKFVWYYLQSDLIRTLIALNSVQSAQPNLSMGLIKELVFPCSSHVEQQAITAFLDRETAKIDALSAKVTTVIERLREYRTALISSAVTGKIDVSTTLNASVRETI